MKPAPFEYAAVGSREEALRELAAAPETTRVLAGGQSLVLEMNHRAVRPARLVDINPVAGFDRLRISRTPGTGAWLRVGPLVRHRAFERPVEAGPLGRLLARTAHFVAHPPIRARGTMLGSLAYAHPTAEWPTLAVALDAEVDLARVHDSRTLPAEEFLTGAFSTALAPGELLVRARFPLLPAATGVAFVEHRRTGASFAQLSVAAALLVEEGVVVDARLGLAGAAARPVRARDAERVLVGRPPNEQVITAAAAAASAYVADPPADPPAGAHAAAAYRRHAVRVLVRRALGQALDDISDIVERS
ncbi:carbon monoxide dehydrogenase [Streptomyces sp. NTH33]|uniref:FAD binding domain-containing protein n=1 Tax=Streptomyces sp. NTH33 TaxID=1735453 RepID=UPI000DA91393|nr:FAD binding domain-containing protein [Streptomyces sp. NTH33]PZH06825.1 carbon monoxide dehydrogenase [Streptomyces sp. NTH33]